MIQAAARITIPVQDATALDAFDAAWIAARCRSHLASSYPVLRVACPAMVGHPQRVRLLREIAAIAANTHGDLLAIEPDQVIIGWGFRSYHFNDAKLMRACAEQIDLMIGRRCDIALDVRCRQIAAGDLWPDPFSAIVARLASNDAKRPRHKTGQPTKSKARQEATARTHPGLKPGLLVAISAQLSRQWTCPAQPPAALIGSAGSRKKTVVTQLIATRLEPQHLVVRVTVPPPPQNRPQAIARLIAFECVAAVTPGATTPSAPNLNDQLAQLSHRLEARQRRQLHQLLMTPDVDLVRQRPGHALVDNLIGLIVASAQGRRALLVLEQIWRANPSAMWLMRQLTEALRATPDCAVLLTARTEASVHRLAKDAAVTLLTPNAPQRQRSSRAKTKPEARRAACRKQAGHEAHADAAYELRRLGGLSQFALSAALFRGPIRIEILANAVEISAARLAQGLAALAETGLLVSNSKPGPDNLTFAEARMRDVLHATITPTHRQKLHRKLAERLSAIHVDDSDVALLAERAWQFEHAGQVQAAVLAWLQTGHAARANGAVAQTAEAIRRAWRLSCRNQTCVPPAQRIALVAALGDLKCRMKGPAHGSVQAALKWCLDKSKRHTQADTEQHVRILTRLHDTSRLRGHQMQCLRYGDELSRLARSQPAPTIATALALRAACLNALQAGALRVAAHSGTLALSHLDALSESDGLRIADRAYLAHMHAVLGQIAALRADNDRAAHHNARALRTAQDGVPTEAQANTLSLLSGTALWRGDTMEASAYATTARSIAQACHLDHWVAVVDLTLGFTQSARDPDAALRALHSAMERCRRFQINQVMPAAHLLTAKAALKASDRKRARKEIRSALQAAVDTGSRLHLADMIRVQAVLDHGPGRETQRDGGTNALQRALRIARAQGASLYETRILAEIAHHTRKD